MNATVQAPATRLVTLELSDSPLHRHLDIQLGTAHLSACLYVHVDKWQRQRMVAYASEELHCCRVEIRRGASCVWIGNAAFDLTDDEAERVRSTFEPHGLTVRMP